MVSYCDNTRRSTNSNSNSNDRDHDENASIVLVGVLFLNALLNRNSTGKKMRVPMLKRIMIMIVRTRMRRKT